MYKTIIVHVDADDPGSADRVTLATGLAADCHAALIGVAAALPPLTVELLATGAAAVAAGAMPRDVHELDEKFAVAQGEFVRWTEGTPVQTAWRTAIDFPAQALAAMSTRADLVIVGPARRSSPDNGYLDYGDLVMRTGRPVLVVPQGVTKLDLATAVVAWRNTREARRALSDALPLLAMAGNVNLIHVREKGDDADEATSLNDAAELLDSHCIAAVPKVIDAGRLSPGARVVEFATRAGAGLLVSGAYGHTRVRERILGGVTRDLLANCPIPCLFSR